MLVLDV